MSSSILKKEFQKSDVARMRNLVKGNLTGSTREQVGYSKKEDTHREGDIWTDEKGKTWTIQNGLRFSVSKLQQAKEAVRAPLVCPKCGKPLNTRLDKKVYPVHGICYDCVVRMEDDLKRAGLYREYERNIMNQNIQGFVSEMSERIKSLSENRDVEITTEDGVLESWGQLSKEVIENLKEWAQILSKHIN